MRTRVTAALAALIVLVPGIAWAVPQPGRPAPALSLPSLDGKTVSLQRLRGKPVYVNFFASWCGPCNAEAPAIRTLRGKYEKRGLAVLGVDELDPHGAAADFVNKNGRPFTLVALDDTGSVGRTFGTVVMPVHVFVDKRGIVRTYRLGEMSSAEIEAAIKAIL